ncbi:MAG TPA: coenzyme F420 hydrogenase subunit beta, partial [Armatimonadetes bacterium]|nr:coenzyme F420 hydrogenase subunit beta [Armatimonadota bacterium]
RSVGKFAITKGRFVVIGTDGETMLNVPIKRLKKYARQACHYCEDFTALLADLSVGSVGSPEGWSTVIVRTELGERVFKGMVEKGYVEAKPIEEVKPGLPLVAKLAESKREEALKHAREASAGPGR